MSRIGKKPIKLPSGVSLNIKDGVIEVKGPKGALRQACPAGIGCEVKDGAVHVSRRDDSKEQRALHGLVRSLVNNMVTGTSAGFRRELDVIGIGYKADVQGKKLVLNLGYSHLIEHPIPEGIQIKAEKGAKKLANYVATITVEGIDKQQVGQVAAEIRGYRKPDSYKGKGIRYSDETIKLKESKKTA
jgi:large subunit ribosomal protein L6